MVGGGCLMVMGRWEANIGHVGGAVNSTIKMEKYSGGACTMASPVGDPTQNGCDNAHG